MKSTNHGRACAQQRSIPPLITEWLLQYGAMTYDKRVAQIMYFDKRARRRLEHDVGRPIVRRLAGYLDCYGVFDEGLLITTGWRSKSIRRS